MVCMHACMSFCVHDLDSNLCVMCVCVYLHACQYMYVSTYVHVYVHVCILISVYIYTHIHLFQFAVKCAFGVLSACMHIYVRIYVRTCMYPRRHKYIYIHILTSMPVCSQTCFWCADHLIRGGTVRHWPLHKEGNNCWTTLVQNRQVCNSHIDGYLKNVTTVIFNPTTLEHNRQVCNSHKRKVRNRIRAYECVYIHIHVHTHSHSHTPA
jgi:hypothetical protein